MCLSQNRILWIDEKNLTARVEAGIVGQDLERLVSTPPPSSENTHIIVKIRSDLKGCAVTGIQEFPDGTSVDLTEFSGE